MEDWASRKADELDKKKAEDEQKEKRAAQKRDILEQQGPLIWKSVVAGIRDQVGEFNKREDNKLSIESEDANSILLISKVGAKQRSVKAGVAKDYSVNFYGQVVSDHSDARSGIFEMYVTDDNKISLRQQWTDKSIDDVVTSILDALI